MSDKRPPMDKPLFSFSSGEHTAPRQRSHLYSEVGAALDHSGILLKCLVSVSVRDRANWHARCLATCARETNGRVELTEEDAKCIVQDGVNGCEL